METDTNPGLALTPETFEIIQAGTDFAELQKTQGFTRIMNFLKGRRDAALKTMRDAPYAEDRVRLGFLIQWQFCEDQLRDLENHIQDSIALARRVVKDINVSELAKEGFAYTLGNSNDDEIGE